MIGFSIMMWFVSIILFITAVSLLKGNTASMHGKVYETTKDRVGYAKASGKVVLFMAVGIACCGGVALLGTAEEGITYAMSVLAFCIAVSAVIFTNIQKRYKNS